MNQQPFIIKRNDTLPALSINIKTRNCINAVVPFSLSAVTGCTFSMSDDCGNLKISSSAAQITNASAGTIQYTWIEGDTNESGKYKGEFELFFSSGAKMSIPSLGGIDVFIDNDINKY